MTVYTIQVGNIKSQILPQLDPTLARLLDDRLSYELPGSFYMQQYNSYAGVKRLFSMKTQSFPTGLIHYVREILSTAGIPYEIVDTRPICTLGPELQLQGLTLRDYQQQTVITAVEKQRGIIKIGTGGGKTAVITGIIAKLNVPTLVLIHKTDIFYQLIDRIGKGLGIKVGQIGDGTFDIQDVTVAMVQSLYSILSKKTSNPAARLKRSILENFIGSRHCIITDETHHVPSDSFWRVYQLAKNAFYRYGVSASPWREDKADLLIEAAHAKKIVDLSASWLIDNQHLVSPILYLYDFKHERKSRSSYPAVYDEDVVNNIDRNKIIVELALKAASQGKSVLIAVTKIEHGRILETMLQQVESEALFICGDSESQVRQDVLKDLDQHKRKIIIATTVYGEGVDIPGLDVLINAKAAASSVDAFQLIGRVLRLAPGKTQAFLVDIFDKNCKYLGQHASAREDIYLTEPRYLIKHISDVTAVIF